MEIRSFERFRIGSGPVSFTDVSRIGNHHETEGTMMMAYQMKGPTEFSNHTIEVRVKDRQVAMFNFEYDLEIPEYWQDAEVVYRWSEK